MTIKTLSQNDPRWKNETLGTKGTIGAYGCLMTCVAMICTYYGHDETPSTLNQKLKDNGGYQNGNLFVWGSIPKIFPDITYQGQVQTPTELTKAQMDTIREMIDKGTPVILQIDTIPQTSQLDEHWILAVGYDGDDFIVNDPWDGAQKRITSWGVKPQKLIYAYASYKGKPTQAEQTITIPSSLYEALVNGATVRKEVATYLDIVNPDTASKDDFTRVIGGIRSRATDLQNQLTQCQTDLKNKTEELARKVYECQNEKNMRLELTKTLNDTLSKLSGVQRVYEDRITALQGQVDQLGRDKGVLNNQIADITKQLTECKAGNKPLTVAELLVRIYNKIKGITL